MLIFVAVAETGSLTRAAERLGLAKTMVSKHMRRLEAEVGASLLIRTTRQLTITKPGRPFMKPVLLRCALWVWARRHA
jgi:DNA-binding transcriptional LysR family regulator